MKRFSKIKSRSTKRSS